MKKIFTLLLVCVLVFSVTVPRAHAVAPDVAISGGLLAAEILLGLGLKPAGSDLSGWNGLVNAASDWLTSAGYVVGGMAELYQVINGRRTNFYCSEKIVQGMLNWVFSSGFITAKSTFPDEHVLNYYGEDVTFSNIKAPIDEVRFSYLYYGNYYECIFWVSAKTFLHNGNRISNSVYSSETFYYSSSRSPGIRSASDVDFVTYPYIGQPTNLLVDLDHYLVNFVNYGLEYEPVGAIGFSDVSPSLDKSIAENYPGWGSGSIDDPDDPDNRLLPIVAPVIGAVGSVEILDDLIRRIQEGELTQEEVWDGTELIVDIDATLNDIYSWLGGLGDIFVDALIAAAEPVARVFGYVFDGVISGVGSLVGIGQDVFGLLSDLLDDFKDYISSFPEVISGIGDDLILGVSSISTELNVFGADLIDRFLLLGQSISEGFSAVISGIGSIAGTIGATIADAVEAIPVAISEAFSAMFEPDLSQVQPFIDSFSHKFDWLSDLIDFFRDFFNQLSSGTPPKIPIHLGASRGEYNYGGDEFILDMSWYSEFKPAGDAILSGILWLSFIWRLFRHLPDIFNGMGMGEEYTPYETGIPISGQLSLPSGRDKKRRK